MSEQNAIVVYNGEQINLFFDETGKGSVNLTSIANAFKSRDSIKSWLRNKQTIDFLCAWEKKNNPNFLDAQLSTVLKSVRSRTLSIKIWVDLTNATGIYTRVGEFAGTYAHRDIALHFSRWLSPEFELHLNEEIDRLREIERKKNSFELLDRDQILFLVKLKEVFKYIAHQEAIEIAHKDVFASKSNASNQFSEFNIWRNKILDISKDKIDERLREYCVKNNISLTKKMLGKSKREKILMLDGYEAVKYAVWDFLMIKGEVNAFNLASLVSDMIKTEKGDIFRVNEDNLFQTKQDLGKFSNFTEDVNRMKEVTTARELLALRGAENNKAPTELSDHNKKLKTALKYNPKDKDKE